MSKKQSFEEAVKSVLHLNGCQQATHAYNDALDGKDIDLDHIEELEAETLKEVLKLHRKAITEAEEQARLNAFKEVLSVCHDNDLADRKWSRGDFIKYMKYELGWNDRSGAPINDSFPDELTKRKEEV